MRKAVKKEQKATALKGATLAESDAKRRLRAARLAGDAEQITSAQRDLQAAGAAIAAVHTQRFEKNAAMRGTTALTAIGELAKLARQQRYAITARQVAAVLGPLEEGIAELREAMSEAQRRANGPAPRSISFSNGTADRVGAS